jgi:hypothetical protein
MALHIRPWHIPAGRQLGRCFVARFLDAANIHCGERDLQRNQCVRVIVDSPCNPQNIADEKNPETPAAFSLMLRRD